MWSVGWVGSRWGLRVGLSDGAACVRVDFGYCMGPEADVGIGRGHDGISSLSASNLTAPESVEL